MLFRSIKGDSGEKYTIDAGNFGPEDEILPGEEIRPLDPDQKIRTQPISDEEINDIIRRGRDMIETGRAPATASSNYVIDTIHTKTDWAKILKDFLVTAVTKPIKIRRETWAKPHSVYHTGGVPYLPGYKKITKDVPFERAIIIAVDTSGSVWHGKTDDGKRFIDRFFAEIKTIMLSNDFKALLMLWSTEVGQEEVVTKKNVGAILNNLRPVDASTAVSSVYRTLSLPGRLQKQGNGFILMDPKDPKVSLGSLSGIIYITDLDFDSNDPRLFLPGVPTVFMGPKLPNNTKQRNEEKKLREKGYTIVYFNTGRQ